MDWKSLLLKPAVPYVLAALALGGWFTHYTMQQREIGALNANLHIADSVITLNGDSAKIFKARAQQSDHAADSIGALLVGARATAHASDSLSQTLTLSYRTLRDQTLAAPAGSAVPTLPQVFASADAAVNACELAKDDCKQRADLEQQRGDSAREAARHHEKEAKAAETALVNSQRNEKKLKDAMPSTTGDVVRAGRWAAIGAVVLYLACKTGLVHCQ